MTKSDMMEWAGIIVEIMELKLCKKIDHDIPYIIKYDHDDFPTRNNVVCELVLTFECKHTTQQRREGEVEIDSKKVSRNRLHN